MFLSKVKQAIPAFVKLLVFGKKDVRTAEQYLPHGFDSKPVKEAVALYADTSNNGELAVVGYLIKSEETNEGESRMYSTNSSGEEQIFIKLTNNGRIQLGGDAHNAVRFTPLNNELNDLQTRLNSEFTKIQTAIASLGGTYARQSVNIDISAAKVDEVEVL